MPKNICTALFIFIIFISCTNSHDTQDDVPSYKTLQEEIKAKDASTLWTLDVERNDSANAGSGIRDITAEEENRRIFSQDGSNTVLYFYNFEKDKEVYPSLQGFTSLDTSAIPQGAITLVNNFINSIKNNSISKDYFPENLSFQKTIIEYELKNYPTIVSYFIGEAQLVQAYESSAISFEIPIRLYFENSFSDCLVYCIDVGEAFKIQQFTIGKIEDE